MTAVPDPQEALRDQIAQAIHAADCGCTEFYQRHDDPASDDEYYQRLADAVLPDVQAHTQALRDAVNALADEWDEDAAHCLRKSKATTDEMASALWGADYLSRGNAARRLRSLLGDKENN